MCGDISLNFSVVIVINGVAVETFDNVDGVDTATSETDVVISYLLQMFLLCLLLLYRIELFGIVYNHVIAIKCCDVTDSVVSYFDISYQHHQHAF